MDSLEDCAERSRAVVFFLVFDELHNSFRVSHFSPNPFQDLCLVFLSFDGIAYGLDGRR
jgi:hypothetical protein